MQIETDQNKKKKRFLLVLLLLLLLTAAYFVYDYFNRQTTPVTIVTGNFLPDSKDASKMTEKELADYAQQAVDDSNFNMRIVSSATISKDTMSGNLGIQNPPSNSQPVNVIVKLNDSDDVVYNSGAIEPGEEITEATLEKKISVGTYSAIAIFQIFNPETKKQQGQVKSILTLVVE